MTVPSGVESGKVQASLREQSKIQNNAFKTLVNGGVSQKTEILAQAQKISMESSRLSAESTNGILSANLFETSSSYLNQSSEIINRMGSLALKASDGLTSSSDRQMLNTEAASLYSELNDILGGAHFNGKSILQGETLSTQVGGNVSYTDGNGGAITSALTGLDLSTQSGAQSALEKIQTAQSNLIMEQVKVGNNAARLQNASDMSLAKSVNIENSMSASNAINMAQSISIMIHSQVQIKAIHSISKTMNEQAKSVLKLLN